MKYELTDKYLSIDIESLFEKTIQEFMDDFIPSSKIQHLLIQNKHINMDGNNCKREDDIAGLKLNICIYPNTHEYKPLDNLKLDVIYEDPIMLVVNKPKGLLVHSDGSDELTLKKMVEAYYVDKNYIDSNPIHRLDKETTGMVIFSKSEVFQPILDKLLSEKKIRRSYLAFVNGIIERDTSFIVDEPIGKDRHNPNKRIIYKNGQSALTKFKSLGSNKKDNYSVIRCILDTGRTHQIRVHLLSKGIKMLNDELYGISSNLCIRMGLVADELEFYHPLLEENMNLDIDLPNDLSKLMMNIK